MKKDRFVDPFLNDMKIGKIHKFILTPQKKNVYKEKISENL